MATHNENDIKTEPTIGADPSKAATNKRDDIGQIIYPMQSYGVAKCSEPPRANITTARLEALFVGLSWHPNFTGRDCNVLTSLLDEFTIKDRNYDNLQSRIFDLNNTITELRDRNSFIAINWDDLAKLAFLLQVETGIKPVGEVFGEVFRKLVVYQPGGKATLNEVQLAKLSGTAYPDTGDLLAQKLREIHFKVTGSFGNAISLLGIAASISNELGKLKLNQTTHTLGDDHGFTSWLTVLSHEILEGSLNAAEVYSHYKNWIDTANKNVYLLNQKRFFDYLKAGTTLLSNCGWRYHRTAEGWKLSRITATEIEYAKDANLRDIANIVNPEPEMNRGFDPAQPGGDYNGVVAMEGNNVTLSETLSDHELQTLELIIYTDTVTPLDQSRHITALSERGLIVLVKGHEDKFASSANSGINAGIDGRWFPTDRGLLTYRCVRASMLDEDLPVGAEPKSEEAE